MTAAVAGPQGAGVVARGTAFAAGVVRPRAAAMGRGDDPGFPHWLVAGAAEHGLAGLLVPREHGGAGATHAEFAGVVEAVARECASSAVVLDVHLSVGTEPIVLFGTPAQRQRHLPRLARGEWIGAFALSEPGAGSDAAALSTRAERVEGGWRLRGAKAWITNAGAAGLYTVLARTGDAGSRGISAFLVPADTPGLRAERPLHKLGLRGSWTAGVVLDDVVVAEEQLLHVEGGGFAVAMAALDSGRIGISAQATGIAQGALDVAASTLRRRGIELPADPATLIDERAAARVPAALGRLADMAARVATARALTLHAAAVCDAGERVTHPASIAKLVATDTAVAVAQEAVDLCAPESGRDDHPAAIRLRDAKACQIYEGTNQVQRMVIARGLLRG